jgi:hypothetical protein
MPRRKKSLQRYTNGQFDLQDREKLVGHIATYLSNYQAQRLSNAQIDQMSQTIALKAYEAKNLELDLLLSGKRVKSLAWQLDIFCNGLVMAWWDAGLKPSAWEEGNARSKFVQFALDLIDNKRLRKIKPPDKSDYFGLDHVPASLVNHAKRALKIMRSGKKAEQKCN